MCKASPQPVAGVAVAHVLLLRAVVDPGTRHELVKNLIGIQQYPVLVDCIHWLIKQLLLKVENNSD